MDEIYEYFNLWIPSPLQKIKSKNNVNVFVKRDDLIHSVISGNKFRKLKYILLDFYKGNKNHITAFGGAYSNLLHALSLIVREMKIPARFYIRGDNYDETNPTLSFIKNNGVEMVFLSRTEFRKIRERDFLERLQKDHTDSYIIPEGASNLLATYGAAEIWDEIIAELNEVPDYIVMDMGTGGTFAGVLSKLDDKTQLIGIPVLKGVNWPKTLNEIFKGNEFLFNKKNVVINEEYHFGGFGKYNSDLISFINRFKFRYGIDLDPLYTGKLAYALVDLIENGYFSDNSKIVWVHGGGLQGIKGFNRINNDIIY
jgi:1-aminocyclopropane-1-carboxylate deaminase